MHKCECYPVKKSSNTNKHLLPKDIQPAQKLPSTVVPFHTEGLYPYISRNRRPFNAHDHNKDKDAAKDEFEGYRRLDDETDPVDIVYPIFKKLKRRNDKIFEMVNYFNNHRPDPNFPLFPPLNLPGYGEINNILASGVSNHSLHILPDHEFQPQSTPKQEKVIGYEAYNCEVCLESESLPVIYDQYSLYKKEHVCDPQKVNTVKAYPRFFREDIPFCSSLKQIIKTTKEWTQGRIFLVSYKVSPLQTPMIAIGLKMKGSQCEWVKRAVENHFTTLNEKELKEFFYLTRLATFCCITPSFVEEPLQRTRHKSYYLYLNHKPCVPYEN